MATANDAAGEEEEVVAVTEDMGLSKNLVSVGLHGFS